MDPLFLGETEFVKGFAAVLSSFQFQKDGAIQFEVCPDGLYLVVNELTYLQAIAYFPLSMFTNYEVHSAQPVIFSLNVVDLVSSLTLFGPGVPSKVSLEYENEGAPLIVRQQLDTENARTICRLGTFSSGERRYQDFSNTPPISKLITDPALLLAVLGEIDWNSGIITLTLSETGPNLVIESTGGEASYLIEMGESSFIEKNFEFDVRTVQFKPTLVQSAMRPLHHAKKVSIRMNGEGILALQYLIKEIDYNSPNCFVDFFVAPLITED